jgi:hypothetical protein
MLLEKGRNKTKGKMRKRQKTEKKLNNRVKEEGTKQERQ